MKLLRNRFLESPYFTKRCSFAKNSFKLFEKTQHSLRYFYQQF